MSNRWFRQPQVPAHHWLRAFLVKAAPRKRRPQLPGAVNLPAPGSLTSRGAAHLGEELVWLAPGGAGNVPVALFILRVLVLLPFLILSIVTA